MRKKLAVEIKEWLLITLATLILSGGVYFFKFPNNFSTGGVSGISVILAHYFPSLTPGTFVSIFNILLLVIGAIILGGSFGIRTAYCSLLMSGSISLLEQVCPLQQPLTSQPFLELIFAVGLPAVGSAILFNLDASSGGTDILAMILKKYTTLDIGKALLCSDITITLLACVAFGMETGLFCVLGLVIKALLVDMVLENINAHKYFHIITSSPEPIVKYITDELHRGATKLEGEGAYTHEGKTVLLTVMNRREAVQLRRFIKATEPGAFLLIMTTTDIIGKGFRGTN